MLPDYQINKTPLPALQVSVITLVIAWTANKSVKLLRWQDNHPFGGTLARLLHHGDLIHDLGPRKTFGIAAFQKPCGPLPARFAASDPGKPALKSLCLCPPYRYANLGIAFALNAITRNVFKRRRLFVG